MNAADLIEILKYASKFEHPFFIGTVAGIIAFILFRMFKNKEGQQNFDERTCLYESVKAECADLKKQLSEKTAELEQLKADFEILRQNKTFS